MTSATVISKGHWEGPAVILSKRKMDCNTSSTERAVECDEPYPNTPYHMDLVEKGVNGRSIRVYTPTPPVASNLRFAMTGGRTEWHRKGMRR